MRASFARGLFIPYSVDDLRNSKVVEHFYFLDVLRTLASICILVWHYYHFDWTEGVPIYQVPRIGSPFYDELFIFYSRGLWGVQLFWIISGFIFCHVYAQKKISGAEYFVNRLARLYPLHVITLLFIALAQLYSLYYLGYSQIVQDNNLTNFVASFIFAGGGFNSPVWSVNAEIGVYMLFYFVASVIFSKGFLFPIGIAIFCMFFNFMQINSFFNTWCAYYFFLGAALYLYMIRFGRFYIFNIAAAAAMFAVGEWLFRHRIKFDYPNLMEAFWLAPFVILIATLDFAYQVKGSMSKMLARFGGLTYSLYLWHLPIQVVVLIVFDSMGWGRGVFKNELVFLGWLSFMLAISYFSYLYIELPLKRKCKKIALKK